jgi:hypothetical protein
MPQERNFYRVYFYDHNDRKNKLCNVKINSVNFFGIRLSGV